MDSIFEMQRQAHEEIERYEAALYTLLSRNQPTHEVRLRTEHNAAQALDRISSRVSTLKSQYDDEDSRKAEVDALTAPAQQNDLSEFYARLVKIQDHYNKYPDVAAGGFEFELAALLEDGNQDDVDEEAEQDDPISLLFSGEEAYGKYVDLYANHTAYNNLKNIVKRLPYLQYLDVLLAAEQGKLHAELPRETRKSKEYENYIQGLHDYLLSFVKRTKPLVDVALKHQEAEAEFQRKWEAGELDDDWDDAKDGKHGMDAIEKSGGVWCSACQKSYSKQTVYDAHLTSKKHVKAIAKQATSNVPPQNPNGHVFPSASVNGTTTWRSRLRNAALLTYLSASLLDILVASINETKSNVERRFSLTAREREQELLEQSKPPVVPTTTGDAAEEEEEEERIYNPLKLPLGWDGKPIPYWLYKLHGLGVEYRCEICSDHVYMGRKNFDRHFQESRHAFGMRALGLPNTKHFHEITRIEDALSLAEKLKQEGRHEIFEQETMEELEDDEGNVYNRKTYEDLKKQGLI